MFCFYVRVSIDARYHSLSHPTVILTFSWYTLFPQTRKWRPSHCSVTLSSETEGMAPQNMPVQRLKVAILPLGLPCSGLVTHSGEILTTGRSHKMSGNWLPRIIKKYRPKGRRNQGRPLKRLLEVWDRNESTGGPIPCQLDDDDDDDDEHYPKPYSFHNLFSERHNTIFLNFLTR